MVSTPPPSSSELGGLFINSEISIEIMPITKDKKKELIQELEAVFQGSKGAVFVGFKGLKVNDANKMRMGFKSQGVGYIVAKKTLLGRALDAAKITGTKPEIAGE